MDNFKAELIEDIEQMREEIAWVEKRIIQTMWATDELEREDRALQSRLDILKQDLKDAQDELGGYGTTPEAN